jgi:beta-glucosidase/6-phospho-beta-glucosidase/beta-galactosidase
MKRNHIPPTSFAHRHFRATNPADFRWSVGFEGSFIPQLEIDSYRWTGHDRNWRADFERVRHDLGCTWVRYPISWSRIEVEPAQFDWSPIDERIAYANELGLKLIVELAHCGGPQWLAGGLANADFPKYFESYAREFARRYRDQVHHICVWNKPLETALYGGELGLWPPHGRGLKSYFTVLSRLMQGISRGIKVVRAEMPGVEITVSEAVGQVYAELPNESPANVRQRHLHSQLAFDLLLGRVNSAHGLHSWLIDNEFSLPDLKWFARNPQTIDLMGLDYYPHREIQLHTSSQDIDKSSVPSHPSGLYCAAHDFWERYRIPLLITETSLAGSDDDHAWWLEKSVFDVRRLRIEGVPVVGYTWPVLDHVDGESTMLHQSGHIHPTGIYHLEQRSLDSLERVPSRLRDAYQSLILRGNAPVADLAMETREHPLATYPAEREKFMENTILDTAKVLSSDKKSSYSSLSYPIIVHCHLRWDFVWQRPQQFLSRLSKKHRILFAEGPILVNEDITPYYTLKEAPNYPNVTIMQTYFPASRFQDGRWVDAERLRLVKEATSTSKELAGKFNNPVQWFYDPMAVCAFAGQLDEIATVYDCMDQLSQFKFAPPELIERERLLLEQADVVFAGGRKMWEDKSLYNPNCHFYGCGVDVAHFSKARQEETALPEDLAAISGPVLGYFGVVDERLDYDLIARLADENPNWSIAMVGPTAKVDPKQLPQRPNLHWLGGRDYQQLPSYTKGFDLALMPFARNEATEYINPTKALEYMATGTPIVSTDVPDVVSNFAQVVKIATNHDQFIDMCRKAVAQQDEVAVERGLKMADNNTWDAIVAKLEKHINEALQAKSIEESEDEKVASSAA